MEKILTKRFSRLYSSPRFTSAWAYFAWNNNGFVYTKFSSGDTQVKSA